MSTDRTIAVLELIAEGFRTDAIATRIGKSKGTVGRYLKAAGTSYPQARRHFSRGGTVEQLLAKPDPLPLFQPTQLDRIEDKLDRLLNLFTARSHP
ncbi:MAG TPA: hypothetical protein VD866_06375 [Urbifossiella sp.]|nr:hypothetical protein [Urbifossiella sp.]